MTGIKVNEVIWTTEDNTPPEKGKQYRIELCRDMKIHPEDEIWLAYDLPRYFSEGYYDPGNIGEENLYFVKVDRITDEGKAALVTVTDIIKLADKLAAFPVQQLPKEFDFRRVVSEMAHLGGKLNIAKHADHYFCGGGAYGNGQQFVTTQYQEGTYISMISSWLCDEQPVLHLGKFELPALMMEKINNAETDTDVEYEETL